MAGKNKKALSPIITTVLLIVIALVLASIIFLWAKGFGGEQISKFDQPIVQACDDVKIDAALSGDKAISVLNQGSIPIYKIRLLVSGAGTSEKIDKEVNIAGGGSANVQLDTSVAGMKVELIPVLLGSVVGNEDKKEEFPCTSASTILAE